MDRCAIFVDAGYLVAEGAKEYVASSAKRGDVAIVYDALVEQLAHRAREASGLPLLRIYWYDGAVDGVPTTEQLAISALPDVKLRLGRISRGRQKGVDALVYRDLSVLARERAIVTAFLLAGDGDCRDSVSWDPGVHGGRRVGSPAWFWRVASVPRGDESRVERMREVAIRADVIRLGQFPKFAGLADGGAHAKALLEQGTVTVDGTPESRRGRQLQPGTVVAGGEERVRVVTQR